jgi:hypothetical protein
MQVANGWLHIALATTHTICMIDITLSILLRNKTLFFFCERKFDAVVLLSNYLFWHMHMLDFFSKKILNW